MPILQEFLISPPEQEFLSFCEQRLEGLELTEDETTMDLYREAKDLGLRELQKNEVSS